MSEVKEGVLLPTVPETAATVGQASNKRTEIASVLDMVDVSEIEAEAAKRILKMIEDGSYIIQCGTELFFFDGRTDELSEGHNPTVIKDVRNLALLVSSAYPELSYLIFKDNENPLLRYADVLYKVSDIINQPTNVERFIKSEMALKKNAGTIVKFNKFDQYSRFGSDLHDDYEGSVDEQMVADAIYLVWLAATERMGIDSVVGNDPEKSKLITAQARHAYAIQCQPIHIKVLYAFVIHSEHGGTGKSLMAYLYGALSGAANFKSAEGEKYCGSYNDMVEGLLTGIVEEWLIPGVAEFTKWKNYITEQMLTISKKYFNDRKVPNIINIVATLNDIVDIKYLAEVIRRVWIVSLDGHKIEGAEVITGKEARKTTDVPSDKATLEAIPRLAAKLGIVLGTEGRAAPGCINLPAVAGFIKNPDIAQGVFILLARKIAKHYNPDFNLGSDDGRVMTKSMIELAGASLSTDTGFKNAMRTWLSKFKRVDAGELVAGVTTKFVELNSHNFSADTIASMGVNPTVIAGRKFVLATLDDGTNYLVTAGLEDDLDLLEELIEANQLATVPASSPQGLSNMKHYVDSHNNPTSITLEELKSKFYKVSTKAIRMVKSDGFTLKVVKGELVVTARAVKETKTGEDFDE